MARITQHPDHGWPDEWPQRLLAGDQTVLHEILRNHLAFLRNSVCLWYPTLAMFADDLVQTALVRVWRGGGTFDPSRGTFRGWFLTVLRHACLDFLRSNLSRSMEREVGSFSVGPKDGGPPDPTTARHLLERSTDDPPPRAPDREAEDLTTILNTVLPVIKRRIILHWAVSRGAKGWAEELHRDLLADDPPIVIKPATLRVHRHRIWQLICEQLRARGHEVPDEPFDEPLAGGSNPNLESAHDVSADLLDDLTE